MINVAETTVDLPARRQNTSHPQCTILQAIQDQSEIQKRQARIRRAIEKLDNWLKTNTCPSDQTFKEYLRIFHRCFPEILESGFMEGGIFPDLDFRLSAQPRYCRSKLRSIYRHFGVELLKIGEDLYTSALERQDLEMYLDALKNSERIIGMIEAADEEILAAQVGSNRQKRKSARSKLSRLDEGWEYLFFQSAKSDPEYFLGVCAMLAVGARPIEVERGIIVKRRTPEGLTIQIQSAKNNGRDRSVGWRRIDIQKGEPWIDALHQALGQQNEITVTIPNAKKAYDRCLRISEHCWPSPKGSGTTRKVVVPYVFRHRFAALLKSGNWSTEDRARALGHASCRTLSRYGAYNIRVSGGTRLIAVTSERAPRPADPKRNRLTGKRSVPD